MALTDEMRRMWLAHRLVFLLETGELPDLQLHHQCHNRACVRPSHLEPITASEHTIHHQTLPDGCKAGHPWTPENTYVRENGQRMCRACKADRMRGKTPTEATKRRHAERRRERRGAKKRPDSRY